MKDVPTAAACGFSALEGLSRRLQYADDKKLAEAVGILVCYAHSAEGKLCAPLPRYTWYTVKWVPCQLENTLAQIAAKRCGEAEYVDVLPVKLREGSLKLQTVTQAPKKEDTCAPAIRHGGRKGPCIFGCQATYKNHHGREHWKAVPSPSPWMGTAVGATLCGKCYNKARSVATANTVAEVACRHTRNASDKRMQRGGGGSQQPAAALRADSGTTTGDAAPTEAAARSVFKRVPPQVTDPVTSPKRARVSNGEVPSDTNNSTSGIRATSTAMLIV